MIKAKALKISSAGYTATAFLIIALGGTLALLLGKPWAAIEYMKKGLQLCAHSVVPSLFPFMIISELLVESGLGKSIASLMSPVTKRLFGVGEGGACAFVLGTLCGFPIGARAAASMYDKGEITRSELERTLTFCNNASPAFIISTVGASILGNRTVGAVIYACVMVSAVTVGILANAFMKRDTSSTDNWKASQFKKHFNIAEAFTSAIRSSALSMLNVCAYVTFFYTIVGCLGKVLESMGVSETVGCLLFGFFELSSGAASANELGGTFLSAVACATFAGWSGMSVHFQIMSSVGGRDVSMKPYFLAKATQGVLCGSFTALALKFIFPATYQGTSGVFGEIGGAPAIGDSILICLGFVAASALPIVADAFIKNRNRAL